MKKAMKIILIVLAVLLLATGGCVWYVMARLQDGAVGTTDKPQEFNLLPGNVDDSLTFGKGTEPDDEDEATEPYQEQKIYHVSKEDPNVTNVLLIGTDSRSGKDEALGRSDSMMLVSYNSSTHTVKLISLLRDSWVKINGSYWGRLNTAFNNGGPGALINTLNLCFDLDVQDYVAVSFSVFEEMIDRIGGITVDLTKREAAYINEKMEKKVLVAQDGPVLLSGELALWYARCRADTDGDFSRTERQRHLMELIFEAMKTDANLAQLASIAGYAIENVTTNLTLDMLLQLSTSVLSGNTKIESYRMPFDDTWRHAEKNGASVLSIDLEENARLLHETIYGK